jgi:hypothetical protein
MAVQEAITKANALAVIEQKEMVKILPTNVVNR